MRKGATLLLLVVALAPAPASASRVGLLPFVLDTTFRKVDSTPPPPPVIRIQEIWRGRGGIPLGGGRSMRSAEDDVGSIWISLPGGSGKAAPGQDVGYRFHVVDGTFPDGLYALPAGAWCSSNATDGEFLVVYWNDGASWDQEPFRFRMFVTAVDVAGNESAPSNVLVVEHDGNQELAYFKAIVWRQERERSEALSEALVGHWQGEDESGTSVSLVIRDNMFSVSIGRGAWIGVLTVRAGRFARGLNEIDLEIRRGPGAVQVRKGVFVQHGDELRISLAAAGADRPPGLEPPFGNGIMSCALRRAPVGQ